MASSILHSSASPCWYTPTGIIEAAREVLGVIDLDPASDAFGNSRVKAGIYYTEEGHDTRRWPPACSVFCNPPGGRTNTGRSLPLAFWDALMVYRASRSLTHAIFVTFNIEQLQVSQRSTPSMMDFPFCVPRKRLSFVPSPDRAASGKRLAPTHANVIVYVPGTVNETPNFSRIFSHFGRVRI